MDNIFENLPANKGNEVFQDILKNNTVRIERIVSFGPESNDGKWYNQNEDEWVILLKGAAKIIFENNELNLNAGDYLFIEKNKKHKVEITEENSETIWLAFFYK